MLYFIYPLLYNWNTCASRPSSLTPHLALNAESHDFAPHFNRAPLLRGRVLKAERGEFGYNK